MGMHDAPNLLNSMQFKLPVQKTGASLWTSVLGTRLVQSLLCLLIIVVRVMMLKQALRLLGIPLPR